jgi:hypothetical protein
MTKVLTTVLAALGLAYACLWWSFERFYGEFGVTPQDVGLAPTGGASDLAGAALQLGIWLLIVLALMAFLPVAAVAVFTFARACEGTWRSYAAYAVGTGLCALTALVYWWLVDDWHGLLLLAGAAAVFAVLVLGRPLVPAVAAPAATRLAVVVALASAVVGITFLDLPTDAAEAGKCAATRVERVPELNLPVPGLELPILSVHAEPATLTWIAGTPPSGAPVGGNVVYLGQANGSVVVYVRATHETFRLPAGDVAVDAQADMPTCPGVH